MPEHCVLALQLLWLLPAARLLEFWEARLGAALVMLLQVCQDLRHCQRQACNLGMNIQRLDRSQPQRQRHLSQRTRLLVPPCLPKLKLRHMQLLRQRFQSSTPGENASAPNTGCACCRLHLAFCDGLYSPAMPCCTLLLLGSTVSMAAANARMCMRF